jgi:hypothetical protein
MGHMRAKKIAVSSIILLILSLLPNSGLAATWGSQKLFTLCESVLVRTQTLLGLYLIAPSSLEISEEDRRAAYAMMVLVNSVSLDANGAFSEVKFSELVLDRYQRTGVVLQSMVAEQTTENDFLPASVAIADMRALEIIMQTHPAFEKKPSRKQAKRLIAKYSPLKRQVPGSTTSSPNIQ